MNGDCVVLLSVLTGWTFPLVTSSLLHVPSLTLQASVHWLGLITLPHSLLNAVPTFLATGIPCCPCRPSAVYRLGFVWDKNIIKSKSLEHENTVETLYHGLPLTEGSGCCREVAFMGKFSIRSLSDINAFILSLLESRVESFSLLI